MHSSQTTEQEPFSGHTLLHHCDWHGLDEEGQMTSLLLPVFIDSSQVNGIHHKHEGYQRIHHKYVEAVELRHGHHHIKHQQCYEKSNLCVQCLDAWHGLRGISYLERQVGVSCALGIEAHQINQNGHSRECQYGPSLSISVKLAYRVPMQGHCYLIGGELKPDGHAHIGYHHQS